MMSADMRFYVVTKCLNGDLACDVDRTRIWNQPMKG
jgi:hypothetical protein